MQNRSELKPHFNVDDPGSKEAKAVVPALIIYNIAIKHIRYFCPQETITETDLRDVLIEQRSTIQNLYQISNEIVPIDIAIYFFIHLIRRFASLKNNADLDVTSIRKIITGACIAATKASHDTNFNLRTWHACSNKKYTLHELGQFEREHYIAIKHRVHVSEEEAQFVLELIEQQMYKKIYEDAVLHNKTSLTDEPERQYWFQLLMLCTEYSSKNDDEKKSPKIIALYHLLLLLSTKQDIFSIIEHSEDLIPMGHRLRIYLEGLIVDDHELTKDEKIWARVVALHRHLQDALINRLIDFTKTSDHQAYQPVIKTISNIHAQLDVFCDDDLIVGILVDLLAGITERIVILANWDMPCKNMDCAELRYNYLALIRKIESQLPLLYIDSTLYSNVMKLRHQIGYLMIKRFKSTLKNRAQQNNNFDKFITFVEIFCDHYIAHPTDNLRASRNEVVLGVVGFLLTKTHVFLCGPMIEVRVGERAYILNIIDILHQFESVFNRAWQFPELGGVISRLYDELKNAVFKELRTVAVRVLKSKDMRESLYEFWMHLNTLCKFCLVVDVKDHENRAAGFVVLKLLLTISKRMNAFTADGEIRNKAICASIVDEIHLQLRYCRATNSPILSMNIFMILNKLVESLQGALVGKLIRKAQDYLQKQPNGVDFIIWSRILMIYANYSSSATHDSTSYLSRSTVFLMLINFGDCLSTDGNQSKYSLNFIASVNKMKMFLQYDPMAWESYLVICNQLKQRFASTVRDKAILVNAASASAPLRHFWRNVLLLYPTKYVGTINELFLLDIFALIVAKCAMMTDNGEFHNAFSPTEIRTAMEELAGKIKLKAKTIVDEILKSTLFEMAAQLHRAIGTHFFNIALSASVDTTMPLLLNQFWLDALTMYAYCFYYMDDEEENKDELRPLKSSTTYKIVMRLSSTKGLFSDQGEFLFDKTTGSKNASVKYVTNRICDTTCLNEDMNIWPVLTRIRDVLEKAMVSEQGVFSRSKKENALLNSSALSLVKNIGGSGVR